MTKYPRKQLKGRRVYFDLWLHRVSVHSHLLLGPSRMRQNIMVGAGGRVQCYHLIAGGDIETEGKGLGTKHVL
jgi:hypothetical protein